MQFVAEVAPGEALEDPQASDTRVVWEGFKAGTTNDREIYQYDGANPNTPTNLSDNAFPDFDPQVSGETVVWWGGVFNDFQIYQYKDGVVAPISSGIRNQFPRIDGDFVVWQHFDGNDDEIYFWDGAAAVPLYATRVGSMFTGFFVPEGVEVWDYASAKKADTARFARFHRAMLDRGVYLAPSQFEAGFVSIEHDDGLIRRTVEAAAEALRLAA